MSSSDVDFTLQNQDSHSDGMRSAFHTRQVNPFETNTPWTLKETLLFFPMLPVLVIRLLMLGTAFGLASCFVLLAGILPKRFQRTAILPLKWCSRWVLYSFGFWWIEEEGLEENSTTEVGIICAASHSSLLDVFYYSFVGLNLY